MQCEDEGAPSEGGCRKSKMQKVLLSWTSAEEQGEKGVSLLAYIEILRPSVVGLGAFGVLVGAVLSGFTGPFEIALAMLAVLLIGGAGNAINDYFDYEIDKINRPGRPIPAGKIKPQNALYYAGILFLAGLIISIFLGPSIFYLAVLNSVIEVLYSWRFKGVALIGNFFPSWLAASTFILGALLSSSINATVLLISMMAFLANTGREIAKAIEDVKGDRKAGLKTLPVVFGERASAFIAMLFVLFAIILSTLPFVLGLLNIWYLLLIIAADLLFAGACFLVFIKPGKAQRLMKVCMFITVLAFLIGIL